VLDLLVGVRAPAGPEHRRQTDDARSVSSPVTAVDVVGAEGDPGQLLNHEVDLVGGLRTAEQANGLRAPVADRPLEAARGALEGHVPAGSPKFAALADERVRKPARSSVYRQRRISALIVRVRPASERLRLSRICMIPCVNA